MRKKSRTPGICRIDQPEKHNHGFFVRVQRKGKVHSAFFTDFKHGGRAKALAAAKLHREQLLAKLGPAKKMLRRWWAEIVRRKGRVGHPRRANDCGPAVQAGADLLESKLESETLFRPAKTIFGEKVRLMGSQTAGHQRPSRRSAEHGIKRGICR